MYTNLYTEIWDSMIFRDMVNKCTMNTKPAKMAVCGFVILREILGLSSSLSAITLDLQALTNNVHEFVHETPGFNTFPGVFYAHFSPDFMHDRAKCTQPGIRWFLRLIEESLKNR